MPLSGVMGQLEEEEAEQDPPATFGSGEAVDGEIFSNILLGRAGSGDIKFVR